MQSILDRLKMGKRALTMEGTLATTINTLRGIDIPTALDIITTMSGDQATVSQLKEELEKENKTDTLSKSKGSRKNLLRTNAEIKLDATNMEKLMQKEINNLKVQFAEEKKQINEWAP